MGPKCPKFAMFRPGEYGGFDIPYVHIHTYIFKILQSVLKHKIEWPFTFSLQRKPVANYCFLCTI